MHVTIKMREVLSTGSKTNRHSEPEGDYISAHTGFAVFFGIGLRATGRESVSKSMGKDRARVESRSG